MGFLCDRCHAVINDVTLRNTKYHTFDEGLYLNNLNAIDSKFFLMVFAKFMFAESVFLNL